MILKDRIIKIIKGMGPIRLVDYHSICSNYYYSKLKDIKCDFITFPEVSNYMALYICNLIADIKHPIDIIELGGGSGALARDILSNSRSEICSYSIFDINTNFQYESDAIKPISKLPDKADNFTIFLGHEYLDTYSSHQFAFQDYKWHEVYVCYQGSLGLSLGNISTIFTPDKGNDGHLEGDIYEISFSALSFIKYLCQFIEKFDGLAIMFDYGYFKSNRSSLRAYKDHKLIDPLLEPGESDITFSVNFGSIKDTLELQYDSKKEGITYGFRNACDLIPHNMLEKFKCMYISKGCNL